jgi:hypothetical protein
LRHRAGGHNRPTYELSIRWKNDFGFLATIGSILRNFVRGAVHCGQFADKKVLTLAAARKMVAAAQAEAER